MSFLLLLVLISNFILCPNAELFCVRVPSSIGEYIFLILSRSFFPINTVVHLFPLKFFMINHEWEYLTVPNFRPDRDIFSKTRVSLGECIEQNILERIVQTETDTIIIQKPLFCPETKLSHK